jgi:hypothetical protein
METTMLCNLSCGGCAIAPDDDAEHALDQPIPERCPQVIVAGGYSEFMAVVAYPGGDTRCACGNALDEDGMCRACTNQQAFADEAVASEHRRAHRPTDEDI